jgi:serine phosphatase RsbU (regulator of sigma subunit)
MSNTYQMLATLNLVLGGLVFLLGLVILRENPHQRLNRVVSLMLFFGGFGAVLSALALLVPARGATPGLESNVSWLWQLFFPTAFLLASIFPEERGFTHRFRLPNGWRSPSFLVLVYAPHVFHFALVLVMGLLPHDRSLAFSGPAVARTGLEIATAIARLFLSVHQSLFSLVDLGYGAGAVALLVNSWRRAQVPRVRQQIGAISTGLVGCLVLYASATSVPTLLGRPLERGVQAALTMAALTLGSGAIAYAMVRHKFLDAKLIARRGILYALASAVLIGVYLLVVERVNAFVSRSVGLDARVVEPVLLIMALTLFQPVISRLEESLDKMFLRDPGDYRNVLRQLGRDLQTTIDLDDLLNRSVRTLTETLLLRSCHVVALTQDGPVVRSGSGVTPTPLQVEGLTAVLPRLDPREASFRLADPVDGLRRRDRELLVQQLGTEILVPLRWRGENLGLVLLGEKVTGTQYTSEDVSLLNALGLQMGVSLQNALLLRDRLRVARLEEELSLAQKIQQTFLRAEFPPLPRCEVHAVNLPSRHVGGDYYDVVPCEDGSFFVAIADVAGKGVPAALMSSMLQAGLRTLAHRERSVAAVLKSLNSLIYRSTAVHQFATAFLAHVDATGSRLRYSNAGHNYPLLLRASGEKHFLEKGGTILGIMEDIQFEEAVIDLHDGDRLVLFTDGISEAQDTAGELWGEERLTALIESLPAADDARAITDRILEAVEAHLGEEEAQDDRTLVVLRVLGAPSPARVAALAETLVRG